MRDILKLLLLSLILLFINESCLARPKVEKSVINMVLKEEMWLKSTDAGVHVGINVLGTNQTIDSVRGSLVKSLNGLAKSDWHLTNITSSRDSSDLMRYQITAYARVPESAVQAIYKGINQINKPGTKYNVSSVDFSPSEMSIENAKSELRKSLYTRAISELKQVKESFSNQSYQLGAIRFTPHAYPIARAQKQFMAMAPADAQVESSPSLATSQKLSMTAMVEFVNYQSFGS